MSQVASQAPTAAAAPTAPQTSFPCGQCNRKPFGSRAAVRAHRRAKHPNNQQAPPQNNAQPTAGPASASTAASPTAAAPPPLTLALRPAPAPRPAPAATETTPRSTSVLPLHGASSSTYTPYIPLGAPVPWTTPAPPATKPKKSKSKKKKEAKTSAEPSATPAARVPPNVRFVPRRDFEYDPDPDDSYYRGGGNRRMNTHTGRTMYLDVDQDWGLCDKECGWCGHCMDGLDI